MTGTADPWAASEAERLAGEYGFRRLEAAAVITSCRTGQRRASDGLRILANFTDVITVAGAHPDWLRRVVTDTGEHHPLYCVWGRSTQNQKSLGHPSDGPTMLSQRGVADPDGGAVCDAGHCGRGGIHGSQGE